MSVEAGASFLEALRETSAKLRTAHACFAAFQIAAALAWSPETAAHLARSLRDVRVKPKLARIDRWGRATTSVAALPEAWRPKFEGFLACSKANAPRSHDVIWSAARIDAVARALTRFNAFASQTGVDAIPTARLTEAWAQSLHPAEAAVSVSSYIERVVRGFEIVLTPGVVYDAAAAIADRWSARALDEPGRKTKGARIVPASEIDRLGIELMAQADAAPLRRISEANLYRSGLMLAVLATLPERARALAALEFDVTLFLEDDGVIRIYIPGEYLKISERLKPRCAFHARIRRPSLHRALARWRQVWRPLYDDGGWLWPSQTNQRQGISENRLGMIIGNVTQKAFDRRVSAHLLRDCVATEIVDLDAVAGASRASGVLRHRDQKTTRAYIAHATGAKASADWRGALAALAGPGRKDLAI